MTFDRARDSVYAGFWWRATAAIIDVAAVLGVTRLFRMAAPLPIQAGWFSWYQLSETFTQLSYFTLFECSTLMGTPGKLLCGLAVVDERGRQLSILRAVARNL
jgi:uncharacterized RDD family membrane protein YckC